MLRHLRAPISHLRAPAEHGKLPGPPDPVQGLPLCGAPDVPPGELASLPENSTCEECKTIEMARVQ